MSFRPGSRVAIPVLFLILFAIIVVQIRTAPETYPWGDTATTSIYALRAARGELATGAYSRFHWNHPGPLLYQILAPLYRLTGYREISLKWTMWMLNVAALGSMLFVIRCRAPLLAITVAVSFVPLLLREPRLLFWAWNPIAPLLALALSIALSAGVAAGELALLPWLAAVASFIVQSHVGLTPVVAATVGLACGLCCWLLVLGRPSGNREGRPAEAPLDGTVRRRMRRRIALTFGVLALVWAVPLLDELRHWPGNLASLAEFFLDRSNELQPWSTVRAVLANQLIGPLDPGWSLTTAAARGSTSVGLAFAAVAEIVLLAAATISAARRGRRYEVVFGLLCLASTFVALFAIRRIVGPVSDYLVIWIAVVGALNVGVIAGEVIHLLRPRMSLNPIWVRPPGPPKGGHYVLAAYLLMIASLGAWWLVSKHAADSRSVVVRAFAQSLSHRAEVLGIERPLLGFSPAAWEIASGTILQFYKSGQPIAVTDSVLYLVGEPFRATGQESGEFYLMRQDEEALPPGVTRHEWLTTQTEMRLVRVFRD